MLLHRNAKLELAGRYALVIAIEGGCSVREPARYHGVSPTTACSWSRRWRAASSEERRTLACLFDRLSRPHRSPRMLAEGEQTRTCAERRRSGRGPRLIGARLGYFVCDGVEGASARRLLPAGGEATRADASVRVAVSRRLLHVD